MCVSWELWGSNPRGNVPLGLKSNALTTRPNSHFFFLKTFIFYTVTHIYIKKIYTSLFYCLLLCYAVLRPFCVCCCCCAVSVLPLLLCYAVLLPFCLCCCCAILCCASSVLPLLLCYAVLCCATSVLPLRLCHKKKSERVQEEKEKKR